MFIKIEDTRINFDKIESYEYDKDSEVTYLCVSNSPRVYYPFKGDLTQALDLALQTKELKNV